MIAAPPPPYGLPPWAPGAAPPVPGPVFSQAFNALLVLLVVGCVLLGLNLRDSIQKLYASDIGTDNELLTSGNPGNAAWLASIQRSDGRRAGELPPVPLPKGAKRGKGRGKKARPVAEQGDDDDGLELARLAPEPSSVRNKVTKARSKK